MRRLPAEGGRVITEERREAMRSFIDRAASVNNMQIPDGAAYAAAKILARLSSEPGELADLLAMCGLVPEGMLRPYQHMGLIRPRRSRYMRPGAA